MAVPPGVSVTASVSTAVDEPLLRMSGIGKSFPGVLALDDVDFDLRAGEVHALIGENGAGKSTLSKILTGVYTKDAGDIRLRGRSVDIRTPLDAQRLGIRIIHQEFSLINDLSIVENLFLDTLAERPWHWVPYRRMRAAAKQVLDMLGLRVSPDTPVRELSVGEQQTVEIARALTREASIIIMDEPTAALTDAEAERLFEIIDRLRSQGTGIVYISHKLDEIMAMADRATVLRDGRLVGVRPLAELTRDEIVRMMVGRPLHNLYARRHVPTDEVALEVERLTVPGQVKEASLVARKGEVVGITGLMGAGQPHLVRAIFGAEPGATGTIRLYGREVVIRSPWNAIAHGIGLLTENRKEEGLILGLPVTSNISLASLERIHRFGFLEQKQERRQAAAYVEQLDIRTPGIDQEVGLLSGGNQQKVVLAKWLATEPEIIIMAEPTRGVDVGAKAEVYRLIDGLASQGKVILLVSSELPEVINLSDRIYVMHEGRIVAELDAQRTTQEEIGTYATGGTYDGSG